VKKRAQPKKRQQRINAAYRKAVEEIAEEKIAEIKTMVRQTLDAIRASEKLIAAEQAKAKAFRADLEDLKRGRLDAITKRRAAGHERGKNGNVIPYSPIDPGRINTITSGLNTSGYFTTTNAAANPTWFGTVTATQ